MDIKEIKKDIYRYVKFVVGGGLSLIINLLITYKLTEYLQLWHMLSFSIALGIEILFLFVYHSFITFKKEGKLSLFIIIILIISGMNWIAVYFLSVIIGIQYLIAITLSAGAISIINYLLNRNLVFKV
jgi:putative flippase GtrA